MSKRKTSAGSGKRGSFAITLSLMIFCIVAVTAACLGGLGVYFLGQSLTQSTMQYEEAKSEGYQMEIKSQVQAALAEVQSYYNMSQSGELDESEAKELAKEAIRTMRYRDDGSGYMWIDDTDYNLVMHPILPEQEGSNRYDLTDQNGVKIIQNIMKSADAGGGYNEFYFTKADGVTVAPKIAYSQKFEPWGWVITTGNYVDDMQAELSAAEGQIRGQFMKMMGTYVAVAVVILAVSLAAAILFGRRTAQHIKESEKKLGRLAEGDLVFTVDEKLLARGDEIGSIARYLERVRESLTGMIMSVADTNDELNQSSERFSQKFEDISESILNANKAIEELAQGATNQAGETETVNNKITELGNVIETEKSDVSKLDESVSAMMKYSAGASESIRELDQITGVTIDAIDVVSAQTNKNNDSAANINKAVEIIKGLAAQTNLLSLNASIEAARAGEAGRGFAVVAEEIRNLSEESSSNAQEIESIVKELTDNVEVSVNKMQEVTKNVQEQQKRLQDTQTAFDHLYEEIQSVSEVTKEINDQTSILASLKQIVTDSVNNLASVVEENAASTQQTSASMEMLSQAIDECTEDTLNLVRLSQRQGEEVSKFKF